MSEYVHGYSPDEAKRLKDQSYLLSRLFYRDVHFQEGTRVLEAGCGVGAQTPHVARCAMGAKLFSLDLSMESLLRARNAATEAGVESRFLQANVFQTPFEDQSFDHVFVCFVLEHLRDPDGALLELKRLLKPGGTITVIEGDHGSCFFHPKSDEAWHVWSCLIDAQAKLGGDSLIGRRLYPLLHKAGFDKITVEPQFIYADAGRPEWVDYFTIKTIIAMVQGVKERAFEMGLTDDERWERGMRALHQTAENPEGVFCYTFFKAVGTKS